MTMMTMPKRTMTLSPSMFLPLFLTLLIFLGVSSPSVVQGGSNNNAVVVETITPGTGPAVTGDHKYRAMVTLYIEVDDGTGDKPTRTPSGWSTRKEDGATVDQPFEFQPGVGLIQGWTEGVLKMTEGERALLHVPTGKGYGSRPMGQPGGAFYIPANSDLLFDIEILGKVGGPPAKEL